MLLEAQAGEQGFGRRSKPGCASRPATRRSSTICCRARRTCCRRCREHVGFAIAPANAEAIFHRIEFVPLSSHRILVVVVARGNQVSQKTIDIGEEIDRAELVQAANYLNEEFAGRTLDEVREGVLTRLREERTLYDQLLGLALRLASSSLENLERPTVCIDGTSSLARRSRARERVVAVDAAGAAADGRGKAAPGAAAERIHRRPGPDRRDWRRAQRSGAAAVQPDRVARISTAAAPGMVGVIGPTRMRYSRAIDVVENAAKAVGNVLRDN